MTTEFSYLTFSVFEISDFNLFVDTVKVIFKKQLITGKAEIYSEIPNPNGWVNPQSGGSHFPKFSCWQNKIYPDKVFFISKHHEHMIRMRKTHYCAHQVNAIILPNMICLFLHKQKEKINP